MSHMRHAAVVSLHVGKFWRKREILLTELPRTRRSGLLSTQQQRRQRW